MLGKCHFSAPTPSKPPPLLRHDSTLMNKERKYLNNLSLSQVAGHVSFVMAISAFAATDILDLRCLAIGATSLSMIFQYYRPVPLKIPLQWNTLVLGINVFMASSLYIERKNAENMDAAMEEIYKEGRFERRGFSRVEFCKFFSISKRRYLKEGEKIITEGKENSSMYFMITGTLNVKSEGRQLATVTNNGFVGEMSFLDVLTDDESNGDNESRKTALSLATADVIVDRGGAVVYEWEFDELVQNLSKQREVANALQAYISIDLREKLKASNDNLIDLKS